MPLDPRIYDAQITPRFNSPFTALSQARQDRADQAAADETSQVRQQQLAAGDRQAAAEQTAATEDVDFKAIIGNKDLTPDVVMERIRTEVPGKYDAFKTQYDKHRSTAQAFQASQMELFAKRKQFFGGLMDEVAVNNYDPVTAELALKTMEEFDQDFAPKANEYRQQILEGGPEALKKLVDSQRPRPTAKEGFTLSADQTRYGPEGQVLAQAPSKPTPEPASIEAMIVAATRAKDGPEVRRLLNLKGQMNAAGRAPAEVKEPSKMWVMRDGQAVRASEADIRPGDQPASTREQGRPVTSGDAGRLAELDTSISDLEVLATTLGTTGAQSKIGASVPNFITEATGWGADAKSRQATIDRVKQVIGKALEGGVLRKEDEIKYEKILPTIGDPPSVAKTKLTGLATALSKRKQTTIDALADAGYDTTKFTGRTGAGAAGAAGAKKIGRFEIID